MINKLKHPNISERLVLRRERKHPKQVIKKLIDFLMRKQKYQQDLETFATHNSYSKTDNDETFMLMKDDYMKNGQIKDGYNEQVAMECQYTLAFSCFQT
jgi:hypothetical protein